MMMKAPEKLRGFSIKGLKFQYQDLMMDMSAYFFNLQEVFMVKGSFIL
jgi:hypothetical protein